MTWSGNAALPVSGSSRAVFVAGYVVYNLQQVGQACRFADQRRSSRNCIVSRDAASMTARSPAFPCTEFPHVRRYQPTYVIVTASPRPGYA